MRVEDMPQIARLTAAEKILLVEDIWDSIVTEQSNVAVPASHREELDRRLADYKKNPGRLLTLDDLRARLEASR
jgi:putative addiction module component (TIGR02574 family)